MGLSAICQARGVWPFKRIVCGPRLRTFTDDEQQAILAHEAGHCKLLHLEKRIAHLWLLFQPAKLAQLCRDQELEADDYVRALGLGRALISFLAKAPNEEAPLHPSPGLRIARLL